MTDGNTEVESAEILNKVPVGVKTSKSAIWSLVCGILGLILCLPAIPAIILGVIGLVNIKKSAGVLKGITLAIIGLILGAIALIVFFILPNIFPPDDPGGLYGVPVNINKLSEVEVILHIYDDESFLGEPGFNIIIKNHSNRNIDNCVLVINNKYKAFLRDVEFYRGFFMGDCPYGKNFIPKRSRLQIVFDASSDNPMIFKDDKGIPFWYYTRIKPKTFSIKSSDGDGEWSFGD